MSEVSEQNSVSLADTAGGYSMSGRGEDFLLGG